MARTSKTNLGGKVDTGAMLEAGKARKGVTEARFKSGAAHERTLDRTIAGAGAADKAIEYQTGKLAAEKAEGVRVAENEAAAEENKRRFELQEGRAAEQHEMDIHARGLQRTQEGIPEGAPGSEGAPGAQSEGERRAAQTEQEMEAGAGQGDIAPGPTEEQRRRQTQGQKPIEHTGARTGFGGFETRPEVAAQQTYDARTARIEAEGDRAEAMTKFLKATRDPGTTPEDLAAAKVLLEKPVAIATKTFDDIRANLGIDPDARAQMETGLLAGKAPPALDWQNMQDSFGSVQEEGFQAELAAQTVGPAMVRFFGNQVATRVAEVAAGTGQWPDSKYVDTTNPLIRDIQTEVNRQNEFAKMLGMSAKDIADKMQRLTSAAGWVVLKSLQQNAEAMQEGGGGADREPSPAPGGAAPLGSRGEPGQPAYQPADVDQQQDHPGYEGRMLGERGYAVQKNTRAQATLGPMEEEKKKRPQGNWEWAKNLPK